MRKTARLRADVREGNEFSRFLGLRWDPNGFVRLTVRPDHLNDGGLLLGPVGFAMVDFAMAWTLWDHITEAERIATVNISINYIQSAASGELVCHAHLDRRNRQTAVLSAETRHEDGRLLANAIGSFTILPIRDATSSPASNGL